MLSNTLLLTSLAALGAAKTIEVQVGSGGELKFNPESVTASSGDKIHFNINEGHNVAQSTFDKPCVPSGDNAIFSGDQRSFTITVQNSDPLWMYCAEASHCERGMVFAVNPTSDKTVDMYAMAASKVSSTEEPSKENDGGSGSTGGSSMSGSMMSSMMMSSTMSGGSSMTSGSAMASGSMMSSMMSASGSSGAMATGSSGGSSASSSPTPSGNAANSIAQGGMGLEYVLVGLTGLLGAFGLL